MRPMPVELATFPGPSPSRRILPHNLEAENSVVGGILLHPKAFHQVADLIQGNRARYEIRGNAAYDTPVGRMTFPVSVMR